MTPKEKAAPAVFQGLEAGLKMFRWVVLILLVLFCFSGIQKVEPDQVGLLLRFGRLNGDTPADYVKEPGLVLALPYPFDRVVMAPGKTREGQVAVEELWHELTETASIDQIDPVLEGYCITGDRNIMQAKGVVKYRINDPVAFKLWTTDPEAILHDVTVAALVQTVAAWNVDDVRKKQRTDALGTVETLSQTVMTRAQKRLDALSAGSDRAGCGIRITALELEEVNSPRHVLDAFQSVTSEDIAVDEIKERAKLTKSQTETNAKNTATRIVDWSVAYVNMLMSEADTEANEFEQVYEEYQKNPRLVSQRLYREALREVFIRAGKKYFVPPGSTLYLPGEDQK
ncbi:MAG: protease modulator HflK [Planctomycetota bacterium]|jgi:membrane protease subunit HflK